jgi:hypothetical protein
MRTLIVAVSLILFAAKVAEARQDAPARPGFFAEKRVDFWRDGNPGRTAPADMKAGVSESIWAEPIRLPDGRYTTYVPPRPVLEFMENPTRENARKYLEWQTERLEKMRKAALMLGEIQREKEAKTAKIDGPLPDGLTLTYFKKAG